LNLTRTIGITIYCYEINFNVTGKSRALEKPLIVMDQLWHLVRLNTYYGYNDAPICPSTLFQGAKTLSFHPIWMWDAGNEGFKPQP